MSEYRYNAIDAKGRKIRGNIAAANESDLSERLKSLGLDLISHKELRAAKKPGFFSRIKNQELIILCVHLEQLERAGVPILDSLADLRDTADSPYLKQIMAEIYESVKAGSVLSDAFALHPRTFNNVFVSLVRAGEKTGNLSEIFAHLGKHLRWINYIQTKIRKATYYPTFLLILMSGIIALMMIYVIPKLSKFLTAQNFALPTYTKALINTSNFFVDYWYIVFVTPVVIIVLVKILNKFWDKFAYYNDAFKLRIPFIGPTIKKIELSRYCHFFTIMYKSGIGILECLESATNVINNRIIKESAAQVRLSVADGQSITNALLLTNQFPNLVLRMFKVGEESGNLELTLENINFFYDKEVEDSVNAMVGVIQPFLTIVMGGIMMWVSISVFGPLYNSFSSMNTK